MTYDLEKHRFLPEEQPSGTMGFISYERLVEQLARAGELRPNEKVTHLTIGSDGIAYRTESK